MIDKFFSWLMAEDKPVEFLGTIYMTRFARFAFVGIILYLCVKLITKL